MVISTIEIKSLCDENRVYGLLVLIVCLFVVPVNVLVATLLLQYMKLFSLV